MNVWLTGENSVISRSFTDYCKKTNKHHIVNAYDNHEYDYWRKNVSLVNEIDIFDPSLEKIISSSDVDIIVHTAESKNEKDGTCIRTNVMGTYYVVDIAKKLQIPLIFINSPECYTEDRELSEDELKNIYTYSKISASNLIKMSHIDYTIVVPGYIYGDSDENGFISSLIKSHYGKSDTVSMNIDPEAKKSFIYDADFSRILSDVVSSQGNYNKKKVNICGEEVSSYSEIIEMLEEEGLCPEFDFHPENDLNDHVLLNSENWKIEVDIKKGLKNTINHIVNKNNLI